jgi:hypothetical protein
MTASLWGLGVLDVAKPEGCHDADEDTENNATILGALHERSGDRLANDSFVKTTHFRAL